MSSNQKPIIFSLDLPWTDTHFLLVGLFMIPFGLFVLAQGTIKKKLIQITLAYFLAFLFFGHEVLSGSSFGLALIGILKIVFLGSVLAFGIFKTDLLGYGIIGCCAGLFASIALLFEFGGEVKSLPDLMKEAQGFPLLGMVGGPIVCMLSRNRSETLASVIAGVGMVILGISGIASKKDFYKFLWEHKAALIFLEALVGILGVYAQFYFQKKERQVIQELNRQMEEEKAKNIESTETDYKKMNASSPNERSSSSGNISPNRDQLRGQPMPQPVRMPMAMPMPMTMGYPAGYQSVPHPTYYKPYQAVQSPVVYNNPVYMNYSGSPLKPMPMPTYAGSPPITNHKPVQDIKTEVSNIHIKTSNKKYDF